MTEPAPCIRCGDFLLEGRVAVPGIALCRTCLEPGREDRPGMSFLPRRMVLERLAVLAVAMSGGAILGAAIGLALFRSSTAAGMGAVAGMLAGEISPLLFFSRMLHLGVPATKRAMLDSLGLAGAPEGTFSFAVYSPQAIRWTHLKQRLEMGLLVQVADGLAFLGRRGARVALPFDQVLRVRTCRVWPGQGLTFAELELRDGATLLFRIWEFAARGRDRAATKALAQRVKAAIASRVERTVS